MTKIAEHIKSEYIAKTTSASTICRTIVFGLIGTVWVIYQKGGIFPFTGKPLTAIILLAIYLVADVSQYFITALLYGIGFYIRNKSCIDKYIDVIDAISFAVFILKISYLIVVSIIIIRNLNI